MKLLGVQGKIIEGSCRCYVLFAYFCIFVKVLDVLVKRIESSMCYVCVIDVYIFVLIGQLVGSVHTDLHVINLILYIFYESLKDINLLFWWSDPGFFVDEEKG